MVDNPAVREHNACMSMKPKTIEDQEVMEILSENLVRLRGERSQYWMAKQIRSDIHQVQQLEAGTRMPGAAMLLRLALALGVSVDQLLSRRRTRRKAG